ncbi:regulatory particle non-ATPase [Sorochytrium milnesiophthora]
MGNNALQDATALYEQLRKEWASGKPNLDKCGQLLRQLKIALTHLTFLVPGQQPPSQQELLLARDTLEIGALHSIHVRDTASFERYIAQLSVYYTDYAAQLPESPRQYMLLGLDLLRLLSQNRIAEFHARLELIDPDQLMAGSSNVYIRHPVQVEQCLMEGSYNKVWSGRGNVPAPEYIYFIDILMETVRHEIASCSEKSYTSLPLNDAGTLLFFKNKDELVQFCQERNWQVDMGQGKIYFNQQTTSGETIPAKQVIEHVVSYAKELERIV